MELTIKDRLYIPAFLPQKGRFKDYNSKQSILRKIEISEQEREELNLKEDPESKRITWDVDKDIPLTTEFSQDEMEYLRSCCERISDEELPDDMWGVVEKIYDAVQEVLPANE